MGEGDVGQRWWPKVARGSGSSENHKNRRRNGVSPVTGMVRTNSQGDGELKGAGREWIRLLAVEVSGGSQNEIGLHMWVPATNRRHGKYQGTPDGEGNTLVVVGGDLVVAGGRWWTRVRRERGKGFGGCRRWEVRGGGWGGYRGLIRTDNGRERWPEIPRPCPLSSSRLTAWY
ncbi:hypothetical protein Acr_26g0002940 [Actinidia rufa]|uniref:Uncharacterized protein n=1 Tax=Actinidia rufa TaxID=165716 RepID=A0A7J0H2K5_9ERIC|nr:hypothetical protein Acr_26g0002940 [Actinidia rufa]